MRIEWYPGHMVAARKEADKALRQTDVVVEVLDARVPLASASPMIESLRQENRRPALKVLNKIDLADPARTSEWLQHYNAQALTRAIGLSATKVGEVQRIAKECQALAPGHGTGSKGLRLLILGIPNVGKSTLLNTWLGRKVAKVGDEPAITKMQSRHSAGNGIWLVDTPGMLWPRVSQSVGSKLAATNSIGKNAYDDESVALFLGEYLLAHYPALLTQRFKTLPSTATADELLVCIAKARSMVLKGGAPDIAKAAGVLLNEFRNGTLGRISLESSADILLPETKASGE